MPAKFVFKVSAFYFNRRTKTRAPVHAWLPSVNNELIQFVTSCQDMQMQLVDVLDPFFVDLFLHYGSHFVVHLI